MKINLYQKTSFIIFIIFILFIIFLQTNPSLSPRVSSTLVVTGTEFDDIISLKKIAQDKYEITRAVIDHPEYFHTWLISQETKITINSFSGSDEIAFNQAGLDRIFDLDIDTGEGEEHDSVIVGNGKNTIHTWGGSDTINLGRGINEIYAGDGNDKVYLCGSVSYLASDALDAGSTTVKLEDGDDLVENINVCENPASRINVYGGPKDDRIDLSISKSHNIYIYGEEDEDYISGSEQKDFIYGGPNSDSITGLGGNDFIWGDDELLSDEDGPDIINGGKDSDTMRGGGGNDVIASAGAGSELYFLQTEYLATDTAYGDSGKDTLLGSYGYNVFHGGDDNDILKGHQRGDQLYGDDGKDFIFGGSGTDYIHGGGSRDFLMGGNDGDYIYGNIGPGELPSGGDLDDFIFGQDGADWIFGDLGPDLIVGDEMGDHLYGESGNDLIYGLSGGDTIEGNNDRDIIFGGSGNDVIREGPGNGIACGQGDSDRVEIGPDGGKAHGGKDQNQETAVVFDTVVGDSHTDAYGDGDAKFEPKNDDSVTGFLPGHWHVDRILVPFTSPAGENLFYKSEVVCAERIDIEGGSTGPAPGTGPRPIPFYSGGTTPPTGSGGGTTPRWPGPSGWTFGEETGDTAGPAGEWDGPYGSPEEPQLPPLPPPEEQQENPNEDN